MHINTQDHPHVATAGESSEEDAITPTFWAKLVDNQSLLQPCSNPSLLHTYIAGRETVLAHATKATDNSLSALSGSGDLLIHSDDAIVRHDAHYVERMQRVAYLRIRLA